MTQFTFTLNDFDSAAGAVDSVIAAVKPDQLDGASPCAGWDVRQVINHLVFGNARFLALLTGGPQPDLSGDNLGTDPLAAWRVSTATLRAAFTEGGALERTYPTPFGERSGVFLVGMRVVEMMAHGWDVARSTGQSTDLEPDLAEACLTILRSLPIPRDGSVFGPEQPAGEGATAADRLAALTGRAV